MRRKMEAVLCFESSDDGLPKIIRDYRARYRAISQVLADNGEILSAVHSGCIIPGNDATDSPFSSFGTFQLHLL
jgi:hypothetical protein